jgi:hypothetical protein
MPALRYTDSLVLIQRQAENKLTWHTHAVHTLEDPGRLALGRKCIEGTRTNVKIRVGRAHNKDKDYSV